MTEITPKSDYTNPLAATIAENPDVLESAGINTPVRVAAFLGQLGHESGFKPISELPSQYASSQSHYKGRGFIQLTGQDNYSRYGKELGVDLVSNPELANDPTIALKVAAKYWELNRLNDKADVGDYSGISTAIGGRGYHGKRGREDWLTKVAMKVNDGATPAEIAESLAPMSGAEYKAQRTQGAPVPTEQKAAAAGGVSTWEYIKNTWNNTVKGTIDGQRQVTATSILDGLKKALPNESPDAVNQMFHDELRRVATSIPFTPSETPTPIANAYITAASSIEEMGQAYKALQEQHPEAKFPEFDSLKEQAATALAEASKAQEIMDARSSWGQYMLGFIPKMGAMLTSAPELLSFGATGGVGGVVAKTIAQPVVKAATAGAVSFAAGQAGVQPAIESQNAQLGMEHGVGHAVESVAATAALGAGFGVTGAAAGLAAKKIVSRIFKGEKAAKEMPEIARPMAENIEETVNYNSAGAGSEGLAKLKVQGEKAEVDIANNQPVSVVPDNLAPMKTVPENPEYLQGFEKQLREDLPEFVESVKAARDTSIAEHNAKAILTPEEYRDAPIPKQPVKPEVYQGLELQQKEFQTPTPEVLPQTHIDNVIATAGRVEEPPVGVAGKAVEKPIEPDATTTAPGPIKATVEAPQIPVIEPNYLHPEYELYKTNQRLEKLTSNQMRDADTLAKWDTIAADESIPLHKRNEKAQAAIQKRIASEAEELKILNERKAILESKRVESVDKAIAESKAKEQTPEEIRHQQVLEDLRAKQLDPARKETLALDEGVESGTGITEHKQTDLVSFHEEIQQKASFLKELQSCIIGNK
jgi:predicted chitinase